MLRLHRYLHVSLAQEPADKNPWLVPSPGIDTPGGYRKGQHARWRYCARRARRHRARHSLFRSPLPRARARRRSLSPSLALTRTWSQCTQRRQRRRRRQRRLTTRVVTCMRAYVTARGACDVTARVIHCFDLLSPSHARGVARSLARARGGGGGGVGGGVQLHRASRASRASRARACTSPPRIARSSPFLFPPRAHTRALRRQRRSLAR